MSELENKTLYKSVESENNKESPVVVTPRKNWGQHHDSIVRGFEMANIVPTTLKQGSSETFSLDDDEEAEKKTPRRSIEKLEPMEKTLLKITNLFSPEKMATLKATKNLLLEVTLGQFDPKSTKMLRTCSVPDLTSLLSDDEEDDVVVGKNWNKGAREMMPTKAKKKEEKKVEVNGGATFRLIKSLEDLGVKDRPSEIVEVEVGFFFDFN